MVLKFRITLFYCICFFTIHLQASNGKKTLYVNDHKVSCAGSFQCLEVKEKVKSDWAEFSDTIQGFDYQEGYKYTLQVEVIEAKNPYAGSITDKYRLVKIISKTKTNYQPAEQLEGKKCVLLSLYDGTKTLHMKDSIAFVQFKVMEGKLTGHGVCNSFNGTAKFDGSAVKISGILSTRVACQGTELEGIITKFLSKSVSWSFQNGILTLLGQDGSTLTFLVQQAN
jgi:heat shock protein HslJ